MCLPTVMSLKANLFEIKDCVHSLALTLPHRVEERIAALHWTCKNWLRGALLDLQFNSPCCSFDFIFEVVRYYTGRSKIEIISVLSNSYGLWMLSICLMYVWNIQCITLTAVKLMQNETKTAIHLCLLSMVYFPVLTYLTNVCDVTGLETFSMD